MHYWPFAHVGTIYLHSFIEIEGPSMKGFSAGLYSRNIVDMGKGTAIRMANLEVKIEFRN